MSFGYNVLGFGSHPARGSTVIEASGGTESSAGGYKYHTFTSSGTFTVSSAPSGITLDAIIVAGGGAGGGSLGGGGGAGGAIEYNNFEPSETDYTITIGAGAAYTAAGTVGASGNNSSAFSQTAQSGGAGGGGHNVDNPYNKAGSSGGSGGGG